MGRRAWLEEQTPDGFDLVWDVFLGAVTTQLLLRDCTTDRYHLVLLNHDTYRIFAPQDEVMRGRFANYHPDGVREVSVPRTEEQLRAVLEQGGYHGDDQFLWVLDDIAAHPEKET